MSKILMAAYGGGHINMLLPVIMALESIGHQVKVLALTTAGGVLKEKGIGYVGFKDLVKISDDPCFALNKGQQLVGYNSANSLVPYDESVAYIGLSYKDLEDCYGVDEAIRLYEEKGRQAFYPVLLMEKFLKDEKPDLVVATNSPRAEKAIIDAARKTGIPSICIVDLFALQEVQWIGKRGYADKVCVLSEYVKDTLVSAGRTKDEVIVTGNPVFDRLAGLRAEVKMHQRQRANPTILWASQPEPEIHPFTDRYGDSELPRKIDASLLKMMEKHPEWSLIIRPHPSEIVDFGVLPRNVRLSPKSEDLYSLLKDIDLVITMTSTVGLEAALLGLPVITIDLSIFTEDAPYSDMGVSVGVTDLIMLEKTVSEVINSGKVSKCSSLPEVGDATDNIMRVVHGLLDKEQVKTNS